MPTDEALSPLGTAIRDKLASNSASEHRLDFIDSETIYARLRHTNIDRYNDILLSNSNSFTHICC